VATVLAVTTSVYFLYLAIAGAVSTVPKEIIIPAVAVTTGVTVSPFPILSAAAIIFFAFAGYARVATLGNEVRDAKRNIPKAIAIALIAVVAIYFVLAAVLQKYLSYNLMFDRAPFKTLAEQFIPVWPHQITIVVATLASLGSMLALLAGVSRTAATMAEDNELLPIFKKRNRFGSPWFSEVLIAAGAIVLVAVGDLTWVIGFSSFSVLFYYAVGHISVMRQPKELRVMPPVLAWLGLILCVALAFAVPGPAAPVSFLIMVLALAGRFVHQRNQLMALSKLN
jgi:APA family basic amino acid/polyamine antiporter